MEVANRVFKGQLHSIPSFEKLKSLCLRQNIPFRLHSGRPKMLCVKVKPNQTILFFISGRFRLMGKICLEEARQLLRLLEIEEDVPLILQTATVHFKVKPVAQDFVRRYQENVMYEPELFVAIRLIKWKEVYVNLFHSGGVVVLGKKAEEYAPLVKAWLEEVQSKPLLLNQDTSAKVKFNYDDDIVKCLPIHVQDKAYDYLKRYPQRLIKSWHARIETDTALVRQLVSNIEKF